MNVALLYDFEQIGHSQLLPQLANALRTMFSADAAIYPVAAEGECISNLPDLDFDVIVLLDALKAYFRHRLEFKGRPWVCLYSMCGSTMAQFRMRKADESGIRAIISNCANAVQQLNNVVPSLFFWPAVPTSGVRSADAPVGCVLPNVEDRDFCLMDAAAKVYGEEFNQQRAKRKLSLFLPAIISSALTDTAGLSSNLMTFCEMHNFSSVYDESAAWDLRYYIPAPRLTDYRLGVVPPDILRACAYGIKPLLIYHKVLEPLQPYVTMYTSWDAYTAALRELFTTGEVAAAKVPRLPDNLIPLVGELASAIATAYHRDNFDKVWKRETANAEP